MSDKTTDDKTVRLGKSTIVMVVAILTVLSAIAFWSDRGGDRATATAGVTSSIQSNTYRNDLQDKAIAENTKGVRAVSDNQHKQEVVQAILLEKATKTESDMSDIKQYLMEYDFSPKKDN
jgi:hypothetical protein